LFPVTPGVRVAVPLYVVPGPNLLRNVQSIPSFRSSVSVTSPTSTSRSTCCGYTSTVFRLSRMSAYSDRLARMIRELVGSSGMMSNPSPSFPFLAACGRAGAAGADEAACVAMEAEAVPPGIAPTAGLNSVGRSGREAVRFGYSFSITATTSFTFPCFTRYRWTVREAPNRPVQLPDPLLHVLHRPRPALTTSREFRRGIGTKLIPDGFAPRAEKSSAP
jgi:hypothetical protein